MLELEALFVTEESVGLEKLGVVPEDYWDIIYVRPECIEAISPTYSGFCSIRMMSGDMWTINMTKDELLQYLKINRYVD